MDHDQIPEIALEWHQSGLGAALATVVETWGSAPRPAGSQLAISGTGEIQGSVSGGCVESAVVAEALEALKDGQPRLLTYGVSDENAFEVGLACGGTIRILVEPVGSALPVDMLEHITTARAQRRPIGYAISLDSWARRLLDPGDMPAQFRADKSGMIDSGEFLAVFNPPLRLMVIGGVHIAQILIPMAKMAGYDPVLIDPREAFASPERFPDTAISHDWPDEALRDIGLDARTAVVTLTHDAKLDDPAIQETLRSNAFYLGCLGSKRTHAKRVDRLKATGASDTDLARIHAPVGLNIGSSSPAEIALSVLAQITEVLRKGSL